MPLPQKTSYTTDDIYSLPEGERAELIDGKIYMMAPPGRMHQKLVMELSATIRDYIRRKNGSCEVYPAPFAVFLNKDDKNYVEPDIIVICDKSKLTDKGCNGASDWIVDPANNMVHAYFFSDSEDFRQFSFSATAYVGIFKELELCIADLLK